MKGKQNHRSRRAQAIVGMLAILVVVLATAAQAAAYDLEVTIRKNELDILGDGIPSDFVLDGLAFSPGEGTHSVSGDTVLYAPELVEDKLENCYYQLVGWEGSGSVPASGFGQPGTVQITADSTIKWEYRKVHRLAVGVNLPEGADGFLKTVTVTETIPFDQKIDPSDGAEYDFFGQSVAISGDRALVASPKDDDNGESSGSVYVYELGADGSWSRTQKLTPSDASDWDQFGSFNSHSGVSISGDWALVGAPDFTKGYQNGYAFFFERQSNGAWVERHKMIPSDAGYNKQSNFGVSVAISGDRAIVGASENDDKGTSAGAVYFFERKENSNGVLEWMEVEKMTASDGEGFKGLGHAVSISGDYAIAGGGGAYIFERKGDGQWEEVQKLTASDAGAFDNFGVSVSLSGDKAVVGSSVNSNDKGSFAGAAYIFERKANGIWEEYQKITGADITAHDNFGDSVSISGDKLIVGAPDYDQAGVEIGAAYIFERKASGLWEQIGKQVPSNTGSVREYGASVSISGGGTIVGAPGDKVNGEDSGSAKISGAYDKTTEKQIYTTDEPMYVTDPADPDRLMLYTEPVYYPPNMPVEMTAPLNIGEDPAYRNVGYTLAAGSVIGPYLEDKAAGWRDVESLAENNALDFDGTDDYAEIPAPQGSALGFTKNFTLSAWVRPADLSSDPGIVTKLSHGTDKQYGFGIGSGGHIYLHYEKSGNNFAAWSSPVIETGKWQHVAVTVDSALTIRFYLNGVEVGLKAAPSETADKGEPVNIGRWAGTYNNSYNKGQIDEVRIWNVARTEEEIKADMNVRLNGDETGLAAYYRFDETEGAILPDGTGNGHDGVLKNMADSDWVDSGADIAYPAETGWAEKLLSLTVSTNAEIDWVYRKAGYFGANRAIDAPRGAPEDWEYADNIEITGTYPSDTAENSFFWDPKNRKLYPIKPIPYFEISWNDGPGSVTRGYAGWPADTDRRTTVNAPVHLQPEGAVLIFEEVLFSESYIDEKGNFLLPTSLTAGRDPDDTPVFQPPGPGKGTFHFSDANGDPVLLTVSAFPIDTDSIFQPNRIKDWDIGTPVTEPLHNDPEEKNGYVFNPNAYYDGHGDHKAHDRATRTGPIVPVNASPPIGDQESDRHLIVSWYDADEIGIAWAPPELVRLYRCGWPDDAETIVIASQNGSDALPSYQYEGMIYRQDDPAMPGFNPNEEHAILIGDRVYAIRNDLNTVYSPSLKADVTTSAPFVLLKYRHPDTEDWAFRIFAVVDEDSDHTFNYALEAGDPIFPLMPLQIFPRASAPESYMQTGENWHHKDHKGGHWAKAAAVGGASAAEITMRWYYPLQGGFYYPDYDENGQPDASTGQDIAFLNGGQDHEAPPRDVTYAISWPADAPSLNIGETLTDAKYGLPDLVNWAAGEILFDESIYLKGGPLAKLFDPYSHRHVNLREVPEGILTEKKYGKVWFPDLPYAIRSRLYYDPTAKQLGFMGMSINTGLGDPLTLPNVMSPDERDRIKSLDGAWGGTIDALFAETRNPEGINFSTQVANPYNAGQNYAAADFDALWGIALGLRQKEGEVLPTRIVGLPLALTAGMAQNSGYLVLAENDDESLGAAPVRLHVIRVAEGPYTGEIKVIESDNVFDEKLTLRHSGDFGGEPERLYFEWYYQPDRSGLAPTLPEGAAPDGWILHSKGAGRNQITLEGSGLLTLSDNWFMVRYYYGDQPGTSHGVTYPSLTDPPEAELGPQYWSRWAGAPGNETAQLAEGWVKRVISDINPLDARVTDFYNYPAGTVVDVVSQLGPKYEGNIAYNASPENLNDIGLIETYQTIRNDTIDYGPDAGIDYGPVNNAILLVSTKLAYFYGLLGNEAYIDAMDPTIGFDTKSDELGYMAASIFAFQNQTASLLEEELTLLRGRDNTLGTTRARPVYNRFIWNFTDGEGELAYMQTYNISDLDDSGVIDEMDGMIRYPQGHGDAWGHYLTAVKTWYGLLRHDHFTWEPRSESVMLAGAPVAVDYFDERKFAQTAAAKAKVGMEIVDLTYRETYVSDPAGQWQGYRDADPARAWGLDGWARRVGQGTYFDWVAATAMVPAEDPDPSHTGIRKIDRGTVPELRSIAGENQILQAKIDKADQGMNPLGLANGVVPFDIDPHAVTSNDPDSFATRTHFEQIYDRARQSLNNAAVTFDYATQYTLRLRGNQDRLTDFNRSVDEQEREYTNRLIGIFGYPYAGDIGPDGTYPSGYNGPDLFHYMYVDLPELTGDATYTDEQSVVWTVEFDYEKMDGGNYALDEIDFRENGDVKFKSVFEEGCSTDDGICTAQVKYLLDEDNPWLHPPAGWGKRRAPGEIQTVLSELIQSHADYERGLRELEGIMGGISAALNTLEARYNVLAHQIDVIDGSKNKIMSLDRDINALTTTQIALNGVAQKIRFFTMVVTSSLPDVLGFSNDLTSSAEGAVYAGSIAAEILDAASQAMDIPKEWLDASRDHTAMDADYKLFIDDARYEVQQMILELETMEGDARIKLTELYGLREVIRQVLGRYDALIAEGERLLAERETFRKRTAGIIQDYRYQDIAFRQFRNSAVQKYRAAFDLAARYAYLAVAACDYDTTALAPDNVPGSGYYDAIVRQRALGTIINGEPIAGDAGLSDPLARLSQAYDVYKGQLGLNNPAGEINTFSLRKELFRIKGDSDAWKQKLKEYWVADITRFEPFAQYCRADDIYTAEPALAIPFSSEITHRSNFFGWPLGAADSNFDSSSFATKLRSATVLFENYENANLTATPRVYLIPVGADIQRAADAEGDILRQWKVMDQKLPMPLELSATTLEANQDVAIIDLLTDYGEYRKFSALRAYPDTDAFQPGEYTMNSRLVGRSVWNTQWHLIIPGGKLLADPDEGLEKFIETVTDIKLVFQTYSYSGNK